MNTTHSLTIYMPSDMEEEDCRRKIIDEIVGKFPDAKVLGPATFMVKEPFAIVNQKFTSEMFDVASNSVWGIIDKSVEDMAQFLHEKGADASVVDFFLDAMRMIRHQYFGTLGEESDE